MASGLVPVSDSPETEWRDQRQVTSKTDAITDRNAIKADFRMMKFLEIGSAPCGGSFYLEPLAKSAPRFAKTGQGCQCASNVRRRCNDFIAFMGDA